MPERIRHPEWRKELEPTKYPFAERSTLSNGTRFFQEGTFFDAMFYPVGGQDRLRISKVVVTHQDVTIFIGDQINAELAYGTFDLIQPPDLVEFVDMFGRPAGIIVSESQRLAVFQSWGVGTHEFNVAMTELSARVCMPTPELGVRGVQLADGSLFTGDVWMVGDDGVVLRCETVETPSTCGQPSETQQVIRVDIVGDPLFRRRLCVPASLFETPRFITSLIFQDGVQTFRCRPDDVGGIEMTVNNDLATDTVLRIRTTPEGIVIESAGEKLESVF